jgi:hypothetical protein
MNDIDAQIAMADQVLDRCRQLGIDPVETLRKVIEAHDLSGMPREPGRQ